jgi:putative ABC transport system permease protein
VAFAWGVPLTGNNWPGQIEVEGHPVTRPTDLASLPLRAVTPGYFALLGQTITAGRDVRSTDVRAAPAVAIVNQRMVDRYFPGTTAIGKTLWLNGRQNPPTTIIGVVSDGRVDDLTQAAEAEVYLSLWQATAFSKDLVVRTAGDPRAVIASVQRELRAIDPTVAVEHVKTLEQVRDDSVASRTFATQLLVGFSLVGTVLTLVGIYGVLSLSVASRRRELAIRTAVGAQRRDIRNLIFAEGFRLIAGGLVVGAVAALALARVLSVFLFEVTPTDPATLIGAALLFAAVALLACWVPTRRAARVSPLDALRSE